MADQDPLIPLVTKILEARGEDNTVPDNVKREIEQAVWRAVLAADLYNRCNKAVETVLTKHTELNGAQRREANNWSWAVIRDLTQGQRG